MQGWGTTASGISRWRCPACKTSSIIHRTDLRTKYIREHFIAWLTGKATKAEIAVRLGLTRQELSVQFRPFFLEAEASSIPPGLAIRILIVDGTYVHGNALCVLVAVTEDDRIFFRFALRETYAAWAAFLAGFLSPGVIVADGQKGIYRAVRELFPGTGFQRCHFHVVQDGIHYLTREPKDAAGKDLLHLLHGLKDVDDLVRRDEWITLWKIWEHQYAAELRAKTESGSYAYTRIRGARLMVRRALPHLFTYLDYPFCPNTTNMVEGWVNAALAEALRRHRGLRLRQKKTLVSVVLSRLTREKSTRKYS